MMMVVVLIIVATALLLTLATSLAHFVWASGAQLLKGAQLGQESCSCVFLPQWRWQWLAMRSFA